MHASAERNACRLHPLAPSAVWIEVVRIVANGGNIVTRRDDVQHDVISSGYTQPAGQRRITHRSPNEERRRWMKAKSFITAKPEERRVGERSIMVGMVDEPARQLGDSMRD